MKSSVFRNITPCRPLKVEPEDGGEMFLSNVVDFQRTTRRHIPEDGPLQNEAVFSVAERKQVASRALKAMRSRSASSSILKMEAICYSETMADFQRTTRCDTPEDRILRNHRCGNHKSYVVGVCLGAGDMSCDVIFNIR
jgi:hypothetical protein